MRPCAVLSCILPLFLQLLPLVPQLLLGRLQLLLLLPQLLDLLLGCVQAVGQAVLLPAGREEGALKGLPGPLSPGRMAMLLS